MATGEHLTRQKMAAMLRQALEDDGMTQAEFARRVGRTVKHVNTTMQGTAIASMEELDYWAFVLDRHWTVALKKGRG